MPLDKLPFNWFDVVLVVVLVAGILRGRKRGMSEELMTLLRWVALVAVCAMFYQPLGDFIAGSGRVFDRLTGYVIAYLALALGVAILFSVIKRGLGGKLIGSDVFGKAEYYLGMPAGMVRFACILIALLALLNARAYTQEEIQRDEAYIQENYGSHFFPSVRSVQEMVFAKSLTGPWIKDKLAVLLIRPTRYERKDIKQKEWTPQY
jgi:uncharacterized membrane protein required for colicin V production